MTMKVGIVVLFSFVSVVAGRAGRSGYNCRRHCGYGQDPVCSTEGNTYDNECMLKCDWAYIACAGRCPCYRPRPPVGYESQWPTYYESPTPNGDCNCSPEKDYVCSYDNETYDNECEARCDGTKKQCDGACPCT